MEIFANGKRHFYSFMKFYVINQKYQFDQSTNLHVISKLSQKLVNTKYKKTTVQPHNKTLAKVLCHTL